MNVHFFTFGPFHENTYILFDETKECIIIDPGCYTSQEEKQLQQYIEQNQLIPKRLILTHAHLDHIAGNQFVYDTWELLPEVHSSELGLIRQVKQFGTLFGIPVKSSPEPKRFITPGEIISFGITNLETFHTPGHSPGSITFLHRESLQAITGDVIFQGSIGRTDLPGGSYLTLMKSIHEVILQFPDNTRLYSGHTPPTTVKKERLSNPFLQ
ncbi:MAG: MBL fold metallo-hydrolase [Bacteroidia bacterium]|nr:MBL fold metallo-hydrolase [Bacteroidia bacterium]